MSLIGKEVEHFVTEAYQNGKFLTVNSDDLKGKWNVIVFYPADFSFVCQQNWKIYKSNTVFLKT